MTFLKLEMLSYNFKKKLAYTYGYLVYDKWSKSIQWRKETLFCKWCLQNWTATCERMKLEHSLTPYIKINSECIKYLNVRWKTIKLEENIGRTLFDISCISISSVSWSKGNERKNKWNKIKLKTFVQQRKPLTKWKDKLLSGRKCLQTIQTING